MTQAVSSNTSSRRQFLSILSALPAAMIAGGMAADAITAAPDRDPYLALAEERAGLMSVVELSGGDMADQAFTAMVSIEKRLMKTPVQTHQAALQALDMAIGELMAMPDEAMNQGFVLATLENVAEYIRAVR